MTCSTCFTSKVSHKNDSGLVTLWFHYSEAHCHYCWIFIIFIQQLLGTFCPLLKPKFNTNSIYNFYQPTSFNHFDPYKDFERHFGSYFTNIGLKKCIIIFGQYLETPAIVLCVCSLFIGKVDSKSYRVYHKKLLHITPFLLSEF